MNKIENWNEISRGYYRYVIAAKVCYEIIIHYWSHDTPVQTAKASLFIAGEWRGESSYFERELLLSEQPLFECLAKAIEDRGL